ncbi:hypothetical protein MRX96_029554 [Rhipicephalus microplus]
MVRQAVASSYTTRLTPDLGPLFNSRPDHLTMKMVAPSKNSGVLEAVNTTGNTSRECSIHNPPRASGRTLLSDDDPDVPRHVSRSGL